MIVKNRYLIALIPPEPLLKEAKSLKNQLSEKFNTKAALKSPPHITLHMPFILKENKEAQLIQVLIDFTKLLKAFELQFNGFGHFGQRVIYIDVLPSAPLRSLFDKLHGLMKSSFNVFNADYKHRGFHPHMTIAFRDLKKDQFALAWSELEHQQFEKSFDVDQLCLLKHDGTEWKEYQNFKIKVN